MNNKGFSLIELLLVIAILVTVTVSSTIIFNETTNTFKNQKISNAYLDIQRAAKIYIDLNESFNNELNTERVAHVQIGELVNKNYLNNSFDDPYSELGINYSDYVKIYITNLANGGYIDSCVVNADGKCKADSDGNINPKVCCNK